MLTHDLDISTTNLDLARRAFSGEDLELAEKITERQMSGQKIDQAWLIELGGAADGGEDREKEQRAELESLMGRLDTSIASFSAVTTRAQGTTAAYGESLEEHVGAMTSLDATGEMITSLAGLAKAMLERTREVEQEMKKSTDEADRLRKRLERARRDAEVDHLTGLPNRRAFEAVYDTNYRAAQAEIDNLSVAFIDIDRFKSVNDTHGHETGDRVLQAVSEVLSRISNDRCHVARHGGEEFVVLFRGKNVDESRAILDQAREQLAARNFINRTTDEPIGRITFSGGVADVFAYSEPRLALKAADQALYRAKAEGRNRICTA
ncbi:diguanylate cyclase [Novosphingobium piscinae]|uniref:GGDEF domain-containing protein n=1 Tax=Novosphingobium piscinae TaxID=1507448 RepID=UPI001FE93DF9|nr:GGDEF domain-containing protein [Novosphingobium piscinae]